MSTLWTNLAHPLPGYTPSLAMALWQLEDSRRRTLRWLATVDPALVDWEPGGGEAVNTLGTLLYHIGAIEIDWVFSDILQTGFPADIDRIFDVDVRDELGRLSAVRGQSIDQHLHRLQVARHAVLDALRPMTETDYVRPRTMERYLVSPAWALHHLAQHEAEHRGEMMALISRAPKPPMD
ncbi:MAG: DinB family protein [Anaerolineae bacterium]|nr:DinB family protein [Anaerolineae bacterium]